MFLHFLENLLTVLSRYLLHFMRLSLICIHSIFFLFFFSRPDLIDWRNIRSRVARERLETAFHVAEREYGVTRLLDPEGKYILLVFVVYEMKKKKTEW